MNNRITDKLKGPPQTCWMLLTFFFPNCRTVRIRCARSMPSCQPRLTITTASKPAKRRGQPDFLYFNQMPVSLIFTLTKKNVNRRRLAATDLVGWLFNCGAGSGGCQTMKTTGRQLFLRLTPPHLTSVEVGFVSLCASVNDKIGVGFRWRIWLTLTGESMTLPVTSKDYMSKLVEYGMMKLSAMASVQETNQTWAEEDDFQVLMPSLQIDVNSFIFHAIVIWLNCIWMAGWWQDYQTRTALQCKPQLREHSGHCIDWL